MNHRVHRILPLGQTEDYSYDALGRLHSKTDFNRTTTTTYNYDSMDRLLSKVPTGGTGISFTYTLTGQRRTMTDPSGTTNYTPYDNRDRLLTKSTPEGNLNYTYDAHGNVLTISSSNTNGASVTYTYDALNRLASAKDNRIAAQGGSSNPTTYSYDATGNPTGYVYPNTVQTANLFDPLNRLTQTCSATSSPTCSAGTKLSSYLHGLAPDGNRLSVTELSNRLVSYTYDNDYRLTSEAITGDPNHGTVNYDGYDPVGNRTSMTSNLSAVPGGSFSYDNNDRLNVVENYDDNGNMTSSGGTTNIYDFENRMTLHGAVQIVYDGDGNRVSETAGGVTTKYLVDTLNPTHLPQVLDETVNGSVARTYAYGLQRISENQLVGSTWTPTFYGYDGHRNVRFLTNSAGAVTDSYDYDAFGMPIRTSGTTPNIFQYSGERFDSSVGLYDLRARYYNQATGRFWARDPVEGTRCCGLSWNPYIYVRQNPVNRIDPTGRDTNETAQLETLPFREIEITPKTPPPGLGRFSEGNILLTAAILCGFSQGATLLYGVAQNLGYVQDITFYPCYTKVSHIPPRGPLKAPFDPDVEIYTPGTPWDCYPPNPDDSIDCQAPCPPGSKEDHQTLHKDPGIKYGEGAHWDYTDCDGKTWKIWPDGTMSPA